MLHRALATLLCLLGAAAIGLGIASATLWRASDTLLATAEAAPGTTLLVTDPGVLDLAADEVTVRASAGADETVVLAVGRTGDVEAWVGTDPVTRVTGLTDLVTLSTEEGLAEPAPTPTEPEPTPSAEETAPAEEAPAEEPAAEEAAVAPDPSGSDLWVLETSGTGEATLEWPDQDGRWSLLVATTGEDAGPPTVSLAWPQEVTTPWLVPGVAAGSALLLAGALWWVLLLVRSRRSRREVPARTELPAVPVAAAGATSPRPTTTAPGAPAAVPSATAEHGGPTTAGALGAVAVAPLTRRQLREAEQQREREKREKDAVRGRFPMRVAGPVRDDPGTSSAQGTAGGVTPVGSTPVAVPTAGEVPAAGAAPQAAPGAAEEKPRPRRLTDRLTGRGRTVPASPPPAPAPDPEPSPTAAPAASTTAPSASADAWRKAWGFPSGATGAGGTSAWSPGAGTDTSETEEGPQR